MAIRKEPALRAGNIKKITLEKAQNQKVLRLNYLIMPAAQIFELLYPVYISFLSGVHVVIKFIIDLLTLYCFP
jgi:hypothetical protein